MSQQDPDHSIPAKRNAPLVSVLMPLFKSADTMEASIESVLQQTCEDWELLLIDDTSPDVATAQIAGKFADRDPRIKVVTMPANGGAAAARNLGLRAANGRYIAFLDADDLWTDKKLAKQIAFIRHHDAAICFSGYSRISYPEGRLIKKVPALPRVDYAQLLKYNPMGCLTVMYDTAKCGKVDMPDLPRQHDYALWLRIIRLHGAAVGLDEDLALYRVRAGSLSSDKRGAARDMWQVLRHHEKLPLGRAALAFCSYAAHSLRHRLVQRPDPQSPVLFPLQDR